MTEPRVRLHDHRGEILFAFALGLAVYLAWLLREVLVLLYVSALFAVVLMPLVNIASGLHIRGWRLGKGRAILLLLVGALCAVAVFGFLAIPPVAHDLNQFTNQAPMRLPELLNKLHRIPLIGRMDATDLSNKLQTFASQAAGSILVTAGSWAGSFLAIFTLIVLTLYFILGGDRAYKWFLSFLPPPPRERLDHTLRRAGARMGKWLLGQASLMMIFWLTSTIVYISLHIRYAYALGVLTGALNIIPVLGAAIIIVLVALVAAIDSWGRVLGVAIFFVVYLNLENSFLIPRVMSSRVDLPGLAILTSLLIGFSLAGIVGGLVAVPTAVLVAVLLDEYLVFKQ